MLCVFISNSNKYAIFRGGIPPPSAKKAGGGNYPFPLPVSTLAKILYVFISDSNNHMLRKGAFVKEQSPFRSWAFSCNDKIARATIFFSFFLSTRMHFSLKCNLSSHANICRQKYVRFFFCTSRGKDGSFMQGARIC